MLLITTEWEAAKMTTKNPKSKDRVFRSVDEFKKVYLPGFYTKSTSEGDEVTSRQVSAIRESLSKARASLKGS